MHIIETPKDQLLTSFENSIDIRSVWQRSVRSSMD